MKYTRHLPLLLVIVVFAGCHSSPGEPTAAARIEPAVCGDVKNMHRVGDVYLAGRPTPKDYPLLADMGVKTVLNIRHDKETPELNDAALARAQGMAYINVPWKGPDQLTDDKLDSMRRALREAERPILFHCGSANRVGAGWLAYRVLDEGVELEAAVAEAKTFGLRTPAYETITRDYIAKQQSR